MSLYKSFFYAGKGIVHTFKNEVNFRIQCVLGILIMGTAFLLNMKEYEKIILAMMIAFVMVLELLNTTIEIFLDLLKPRMSPHVASVKDIMAGAVLLASVGSVIVGVIIFSPYIVELLH